MLTIIQDGQPMKARTERHPGHFWADREIVEVYLPDLSIYAFSIYMLLCYYSRSKTGRSHPSIKTIAKQLKVSMPTVRKGLNELSEAKLIVASPNYKTTKAGKVVQDNYTFTLSEINRRSEGTKPGLRTKPGLVGGVNGVEEGTKPGLVGVLNQVYPNKNNITRINNKNDSTIEEDSFGVVPTPDVKSSEIPNIPEVIVPDIPVIVPDLTGELESKNPPVAATPLVEFPPAPEKTRWIYPLDGERAHLVREANQPTVTFCGIRPLPSYGGMQSEANPQQPCPICLEKAMDRTQDHMRPIEAWRLALEKYVPKTFSVGAFSRFSKELFQAGITSDEMRSAGLLFKAWLEAHPAIPVVNWQIQIMRGVINAALVLHHEGITPAEMMVYVKGKKGEDYWKGQTVSFDYVAKNITTWKVERVPDRKSNLIPDPRDPKRMMTPGELRKREAEEANYEAKYGRKFVG